MKTLFYNPDTKVIFASEDPQSESIQTIANVAVPDLIANGATVDSSADSLMSGDSGNAVAGAPAPDASATGSDGDSGNVDAAANTSPSVAAASDAGSAPQESPASADVTTGPGAEINSGDPAQVNAAVGEPAPLGTGTTVDVTQVGDQTVNSNVQNGNQLAGSNPQMVTDDNANPVPAASVPVGGNVLVNDTPVVDAPVVDGDTKTITNVENELNPLVPAAGTEGAPASQLAAQAEEPEPEPLPRESHLMLLEAKFASALARLRNGERVFVDEIEAIYAHVKAVL